jgi:hypothetical protein
MLTLTLPRLLTLLLLLFGASSMFADICEDYARAIDTHIAMLRVVEKRANAVADSKQAVEVINQYVDEMISCVAKWLRSIAPCSKWTRETSKMRPLCARRRSSASIFSPKKIWISQKSSVTCWSNTSATQPSYLLGGACRICRTGRGYRRIGVAANGRERFNLMFVTMLLVLAVEARSR